MTITNRSLTTGEVEGSGLFDELMRTVKAHTHLELQDGRITEKDYSQVYLGALQATLSGALQYTLQKDLTNKQIQLAEKQLLQADKQNELLELQKEQLQLANDTARYNLSTTLPAQTDILLSQKAQIDAQTAVAGAQLNQVTAQALLVGKQEDLVDEQIAAATYQYTDVSTGTIGAQQLKAKAEIEILNQKKITEQKQTTGTADDTAGLIGTEMKLKNLQAESFVRDAEQKAAKLYTDAFSVLASIESEGLDVQEWGLGSDESFEVFKKIQAGIGIVRTPTHIKG